MDIHKQAFVASLPMLQKAIAECDFVAMDTELTGRQPLQTSDSPCQRVHTNVAFGYDRKRSKLTRNVYYLASIVLGLAVPANAYKLTDTTESRYLKSSMSAVDFLVTQLGICTFTWSDEIGGYEARPFNFPCFPISSEEAKAGERFFKCQSSSLEFLLINGFDFNNWIRHGIPYLTRSEEAAYISSNTERTTAATPSLIPVDGRNREFVESTIAKIKEWMQSSTEPTLTVPAANSFFRRLVYQTLQTDFNNELCATSNALARTMTVQRLTDEVRQQQEEAKIVKPPALNLRRVLDMISDARKPLIGHNCLLDLLQINQQFLGDLPLYLKDWKKAVNVEWKLVIDTKHLSTHPLIRPLLEMTSLDVVSRSVQKEPFATVGPKIVMAKGFDRYPADASLDATKNGSPEGKDAAIQESAKKDDIKYHEAGYDAYITGQAFLRFAGYILKERERFSTEEEEEHARKKRKLEDEEDDSIFANALQAVQEGSGSATPTGAKSTDANEQEADEEEEEDGEVQETSMEKIAFLEKRKRVIMDNPTSDILETEELKGYYNLLHLMRSDTPFMNLAGKDPEPEEQPYSYYLKNIPERLQTSTLLYLFASFNPYRFLRADGTSGWLKLSAFPPTVEGEEPSRDPYEPTPLPLGRLGEEYVNPHCVGTGEAAVKGRDAGVFPEAANIDVLSWRTWYEERVVSERQQCELLRQQLAQQQQQPNGRYHKRVGRGPETTALLGKRSLDSVLPEQDTPTSEAAGIKRKHGEVDNGVTTPTPL